MNVYQGLEAVSRPFAEATVAIGTFDGVHLGHQAIIRSAVEDSCAHGRPSLVFTFDRHPFELLAPDRMPGYLTSPAQRNAAIAELGVDGLVAARFDRALARLSPEAFISDILKARLGARAVVVGSNFYFGKGRAGDFAFLQARQERYDYTLFALDPVMVEGAPASSTRIRDAIRAGNMQDAERILGRPYRLAGTVGTGRKLGRTLGFPTANLALTCAQVLPPDGVWAVQATLAGGRTIVGACSIGFRPTVEGVGRTIETYLLDFNEEIYGAALELRFISRLRGEQKFDSLEALTAQMRRDVEVVRQITGNIAPVGE